MCTVPKMCAAGKIENAMIPEKHESSHDMLYTHTYLYIIESLGGPVFLKSKKLFFVHTVAGLSLSLRMSQGGGFLRLLRKKKKNV